MRDFLFPLRHGTPVGLQVQLRRQLVDAILDGRLSTQDPLPSCRGLARILGVSRNTVVLAYQALADEGYLIARERIGYFVNPEMLEEPAPEAPDHGNEKEQDIDLYKHLKIRPSQHGQLTKPAKWHSYPYPFIYGQVDSHLFPVAAWRNCSRQAQAISAIRDWAEDSFTEDDPLLIEEIRTRVLPRRGVRAAPDEILITLGAQNALYLVARLLANGEATVGCEDPGYVDARQIFALTGARLLPLPVDRDGLIIDEKLNGCDFVYVTPSHQSPTTVTLNIERRNDLLEKARAQDFLIVEDDYEAETNFVSRPTSALKALDRNGRVVYIGSFSKWLAPGIRMGFLVGPKTFIREARLLRRLILRHPPANNQRTVGLFISGGHYDAMVHRLQRSFRERWEAMADALARHLPDSTVMPSFGGSSFWIHGPEKLDSARLAEVALRQGIVFEPGAIFFMAERPPLNMFRLGFSSISVKRIEPGVRRLAELMDQVLGGDTSA